MKKLLGISVIAMLAVAPAFADPVGTGSTPSNDATASIIETNPPFAEVAANSATDSNAASAGYVKGAYNAAIKAINKVNAKVNSELATSAGNGIAKTNGEFSVVAATDGGIAVSGSGVSVDHGDTLEMTGTAGSKKLDVKVDGTTIEKSGSGALQVKSGIFDASGAAAGVKSDIEGKLDDGANGYDIDAKTLKVSGATVATQAYAQNGANLTAGTVAKTALATDVQTSLGLANTALQSADIADMATQTGVDNTIDALSATVNDGFVLTSGTVTGSVTVPIMNDWSNPNTASSVVVNGNNISLSVGTAITEGTVTINKTAYATANTPSNP